jgi:hypothetical protein
MAKKNVVPIDYTARNFSAIKGELINYAKKYYPDTFKDFNEASFGALLLDSVAYVGDMLSFYLDYHANESYLETSLEYDNIVRLAKQSGYKHTTFSQTYGSADLYVLIPSKELDNEPDLAYVPTLLKGSSFSTVGGSKFTLLEDLNFLDANTDVVGTQLSSDGTRADYYTLKSSGTVVSGNVHRASINVGDFRRFLKIEIPSNNVGEIVSVFDSEGNEYFEVDHLSQNVIYKPIANTGANRAKTPSILKPFPVPRRFMVDTERDRASLIFGYGSERDIKKNNVADPSDIALNFYGRDYVSDLSMDPKKLVSSDKFGVTPVNTTLAITYRSNDFQNANAAARTLTIVNSANLLFRNENNLNSSVVNYIKNSIRVLNNEPIQGFTTVNTTEEIKKKALHAMATQSRAVTKQDYIAAAYSMPSKFGSIKRCTIFRDDDDLRRNLNMYIVSESASGYLERTNTAIKTNLGTWLNQYRMISDSIDIFDVSIVNLGIDFDVIVEDEKNKFDILQAANQAIIDDLLQTPPEIGEPFYITDVFKALKDVDGILDVIDVRMVNKRGTNYSDFELNIRESLSLDGRRVDLPFSSIWEIKYPSIDIRGSTR